MQKVVDESEGKSCKRFQLRVWEESRAPLRKRSTQQVLLLRPGPGLKHATLNRRIASRRELGIGRSWGNSRLPGAEAPRTATKRAAREMRTGTELLFSECRPTAGPRRDRRRMRSRVDLGTGFVNPLLTTAVAGLLPSFPHAGESTRSFGERAGDEGFVRTGLRSRRNQTVYCSGWVATIF